MLSLAVAFDLFPLFAYIQVIILDKFDLLLLIHETVSENSNQNLTIAVFACNHLCQTVVKCISFDRYIGLYTK